MNFTKRDFKMFALGFFTLLIIDAIVDWEGTKESIKRGYNATI